MLSRKNKKYPDNFRIFSGVTLIICLLIASSALAGSYTITSLPYTASQRGSNFSETLTVAGTNLVSTTNGINFTGHDIVLMLVGDTITFAHSDSVTGSGTSSSYRYGLRFQNAYNIKVIGGFVLSDPTGTNTTYLTSVLNSNMHDVTFDGTKFVIKNGYNSHNFSGIAPAYNVDFDGCIFEDKVTEYTSRCNFSGVSIQVSHPTGYGSQGFQDGYHHFSFYGCKTDTANGGAYHFYGVKMFVERCTTYVDNLNERYTYPNGGTCEGTTNNGHCTCSLIGAGSYIKNNYMISRMNHDGTDMGILMELARGTEMNPVVICSNYVDVMAGLDAHYGYMNAKALKTRYGNDYLQIFDNTFIAHSGTGHPNCETYNILAGIYGTDFSAYGGNEPDSHMTIERNYFEARADDDNFSSCRAINAAIGNNAPTYVWYQAGNVWRNNHVKSAGNIYEFSGYDGPGRDMLIDSDVVEFDPNSYGRTRYTFKVGYYLASTGNIARDCYYTGGATDTSITFSGSYDASIAIQRTLNILVMGNNDCPVGNANVTVVDNYGHTVLSGSTSGNGLLTGPVTYYFEARNTPDSLNYNNFTITAVKSGETEITTVTVDRTHASATLQFDNVAGDCDVDNTPPGAIYDLNAIPGEDHGEIALTWTAPGDDGTFGIADHYDIRYSTSAIFESNWSSANSCASPPTPASPGQIQTYTIDGLAEGEAYFVAIKTYDDYDNASAISNLPDTFAAGIAVPVQLATDIDIENFTVELTSSVVESYEPLYYKFMLDSLENYPDPMITLDLLADVVATATYSDLSLEVTYYWRVCAVAADNSDSSAWSSSTSFNLMTGVNQTLTSADCVYPLAGDIVGANRPYLEVNNLTDISQYYFQLSDNSQFNFSVESGAVAKSSGLTTTWQVPDPLENGGQYFWRVSSDSSAWTSALAFTVQLNVHPYPNPFRPSEGHSQIVFTNLPENADLTISTISGNIVLEQNDIGPDDWAWDVKNESGKDLVSGIYLYSISSAAGSTTGKVVVIR